MPGLTLRSYLRAGRGRPDQYENRCPQRERTGDSPPKVCASHFSLQFLKQPPQVFELALRLPENALHGPPRPDAVQSKDELLRQGRNVAREFDDPFALGLVRVEFGTERGELREEAVGAGRRGDLSLGCCHADVVERLGRGGRSRRGCHREGVSINSGLKQVYTAVVGSSVKRGFGKCLRRLCPISGLAKMRRTCGRTRSSAGGRDDFKRVARHFAQKR